MQLDKNTATKTITIKGAQFVVPAPYTEGHVLKANEADVLNQTLSENLRNNFASTVADAIEKAGDLSKVDISALQAELNKYVEGYEFGVRRTGSGEGRVVLEPRVRIARDLAKEKVKEAIRAKGKKVSDFPAEQINSLAMQLVEKDARFYEEADRQLKTQQKLASEIDLSGLSEKAPEEANAEGKAKKAKAA